jgi:hypothetical protein
VNLPLLIGSLVAVLATAGVVAWLGLGREGRIDDALRLAEDLLPDFEADEAFADAGGRSALVHGRDGSWAILRVQGLHPVARRFSSRPNLIAEGRAVLVDSGERQFGLTRIVNDRLLTLV